MPLKFSENLRNARATAILNAIDAGGAGSIAFYDLQQTLLVTLPLSTPCGIVANGTLNFNQIQGGFAITNGLIDSAKILNGGGQFVMSLDCGDTTSTATVRLDNLDVKEGGNVSIASAAILEGNAL